MTSTTVSTMFLVAQNNISIAIKKHERYVLRPRNVVDTSQLCGPIGRKPSPVQEPRWVVASSQPNHQATRINNPRRTPVRRKPPSLRQPQPGSHSAGGGHPDDSPPYHESTHAPLGSPLQTTSNRIIMIFIMNGIIIITWIVMNDHTIDSDRPQKASKIIIMS